MLCVSSPFLFISHKQKSGSFITFQITNFWFVDCFYYISTFDFVDFCSLFLHLHSLKLSCGCFFLTSHVEKLAQWFPIFLFLHQYNCFQGVSYFLSPDVAASLTFWSQVFSLSFRSKYFLTSIMISYLVHGLFRNFKKFFQDIGFLFLFSRNILSIDF